MKGAKDPDEFIIKYGPERFKKLMDESISYAEYKINRLKDGFNFHDTTDKIHFLTKMAEILSKIENNIERDVYVDKFSQELGVGKEAILAEIEKKTLRSAISHQPSNNISQSFLKEEPIKDKISKSNEDLVIYLLCKKDKTIFERLRANIDADEITDVTKITLLKKLYDLYETGNINSKSLDSICENEQEMNLLTQILMNDNVNLDTDKVLLEVIKTFQLNKLVRRKNELINQLSSVTTNEERESIAIELNEINRQLMIR